MENKRCGVNAHLASFRIFDYVFLKVLNSPGCIKNDSSLEAVINPYFSYVTLQVNSPCIENCLKSPTHLDREINENQQ